MFSLGYLIWQSIKGVIHLSDICDTILLCNIQPKGKDTLPHSLWVLYLNNRICQYQEVFVITHHTEMFIGKLQSVQKTPFVIGEYLQNILFQIFVFFKTIFEIKQKGSDQAEINHPNMLK